MEQVNSTYGAAPRIQRGNYTEGALARARLSDLLILVGKATQNVVVCERRHEDLSRPVTMAIAARDVVGMDLEEAAANCRLGLVNRSRFAFRERPVTDIFEGGSDELVNARVDEKADAFGRLNSRIEKYLPAEDPVRIEFVPVITALLVEWNAAVAVITAAEQELDLARQARDNALVDWDATMVKVYGLLVAKVGKKRADWYFFRTKKTRAPKPAPVLEPTTPTPPPVPQPVEAK